MVGGSIYSYIILLLVLRTARHVPRQQAVLFYWGRLASKCMLADFAANNKSYDGHWSQKLEGGHLSRDQQIGPSRALRDGKLVDRLTLGNP